MLYLAQINLMKPYTCLIWSINSSATLFLLLCSEILYICGWTDVLSQVLGATESDSATRLSSEATWEGGDKDSGCMRTDNREWKMLSNFSIVAFCLNSAWWVLKW